MSKDKEKKDERPRAHNDTTTFVATLSNLSERQRNHVRIFMRAGVFRCAGVRRNVGALIRPMVGPANVGDNRNSTAKHDIVSRDGGDSGPRHQNSHEIQGIRRGNFDLRSSSIPIPADRPKSVHSHGQSELLTDKAGDESPAAELAPQFHSPILHQKIAPRRGSRLPSQQIPKHDAIAMQKLTRDAIQPFW